jgi:hypothetical protein
MTKIKIYSSKVKTRWFFTIIVSVWTAMGMMMFGILSYGLIGMPSRINDLWGAWIIIAIVLLLAINYIKWQIKGQEKLTISTKHIQVYKTGIWFTRKLKINYFDIQNIQIDNDKATSRWIKLWGIGGGKIIISYLGRKKRFGQDLTEKEAILLYDEIKNEFNLRKNNVNSL